MRISNSELEWLVNLQFPILILFLFGIYNLHLERNERQQWGSKDLKTGRNRISIMLFPGLVGGGGNWPLAAKSSTISPFGNQNRK